MSIFVGGVGAAGLATLGRYFTQYVGNRILEAKWLGDEPRRKHWKKIGDALTWTSIAFGLGSMLAFCIGGVVTYFALT